MNSGDPDTARRVTEAMLRMVKFDIAGLEAAAKGENPHVHAGAHG
jgi:hypothetical protein